MNKSTSMEISSFLRKHKGQTYFLPAHSRGKALPLEFRKLLRGQLGAWDLPELPGFGGPLFSYGAVSDSQNFSACSFGADRCWYGVNGATGLLQAAILSLAKPGSAIVLPRNVHRSVIQACSLGDITPFLFDLPFLSDRGHYIPPNASWLKKVLDSISSEGREISGVLLVNPSYQGYSTDISELIEICHLKGFPVIVDEAHGTHFAVGLDHLPKSALNAKADLVVHSLHKSATGLSQTAVLWMQGNKIDPIAVERSIGMLQTTSPSSLLLASCESTLREMQSPHGLKKLESCINASKEIFEKLSAKGIPLFGTQDPLKLLLHSGKYGISGFEADEWMISQGIYAELPEPATLTFCLGLALKKGFITTIEKNWFKLISDQGEKQSLEFYSSPPVDLIMQPKISCFSASRMKSKLIFLKDAVGEISSDIICPYPPGIPFVIPGQLLTEKYILWLLDQTNLWPNFIPKKIRVVA
tara:strand:- start:792 stop:2204 length:1413 start_codon:yes stop_codon:yes gene_type:complete